MEEMAEYSNNIFIRAAASGNVRVLKQMLKKGANVNRCDLNGKTPLIVAAENGHSEAMCVLIEAGADVNRRTNGRTPLMVALNNGHDNAARLLIDGGADVHDSLEHAAWEGNTKCVSLLIETRSDLNLFYPLRCAVENNHVECARLLIKAGADKNINDLLCLASREGHHQCVNLLLEAGADVTKGYPLHQAVKRGHVKCVTLLINGGADINRIDDCFYKRTPLICAVENDHVECASALIESGADVNHRNQLYYAARSGHIESIKLLINAGADVNMIHDIIIYHMIHDLYNYETPLVPAVRNGHIGCVSALIKAEADVNHENCHDLLGHAHSVQMVRLLLKSGVKINKGWGYRHGDLRPEKPAMELLFAAGDTQWSYSPKKADDLMGMCREAIREHLLKLDEHTHLFGRVTRLGLPAALVNYLVFDQSLDDDVKHDFNEEN